MLRRDTEEGTTQILPLIPSVVCLRMTFYVFFKALELEKFKVVIILKKTSGGMNWKNPDSSFF
jgi:hypothetical protein